MWLEGKLPKDALQKYAVQYYQLVAHLPRFISRMHTNCDDSAVRQQLLQNINEEEKGEGNGNISHAELWLDFAEELGVPREQVVGGLLLSETSHALQMIYECCENSLVSGAGALYAYESQVPEISTEKIKGLIQNYGLHSVKALRFFRVHSVVDKKHSKVWEDIAEGHADAENACEKTARALWAMFDAMYEQFVPKEMRC